MDWHHFELLLRARSLQEVWSLAARFGLAHGFDRFSFARSAPAPSGPLPAFLFTHSYTEGPYWSERCRQLERLESARSDAIVLHVLTRQPPTVWNSRGDVAATGREVIPAARRLMTRVREHNLGIGSGITIPIHGSGVSWSYMGFTSPDTSDVRDVLPHLSRAHTYAHFVDSALHRICAGVRSQLLSARECEVLAWSAAGKTAWEIGRILAVSEATIRFHLRNASRKLNVRGTRAAIARAISTGEILP